MKVLVHLNHGIDKSYMLNFGNKVKNEDIKKVLRLGEDDAAAAIYGYANLHKSVQKIEVTDQGKTKAGIEADFVVGHQGVGGHENGTTDGHGGSRASMMRRLR